MIDQRDRAVREYRLAVGTKGDLTEGTQAIAVARLSQGVKGSDASLHHVLAPYTRYIKTAKPRMKVPAEYSREARVAGLQGSAAFVATIGPDG